MTVLDILIVVLVGAFIISRLTGFDLPKAPRGKQKGGKRKSTILDFPKTPSARTQDRPQDRIGGEDEGTYVARPQAAAKDLTGLAAVKAAEPGFNEKEFLAGAEAAYRYYYDQFNAKNDDALADLLAPVLLNDVVAQFNALDAKGHTPEVAVDKVDKAVIADARLNGRTMVIDVQFTATQAENMLTKTGKYVSGKKKPMKQVKSLWTFARAVGSEDPNWDIQVIQKAS